MVSILSPGVYVIEKDVSTYPVSIAGSTVGIVGYATKGPVNKATLITTQENLIETFGYPKTSLTGQGLEGALEILEATNQIYFVRAVDGTEAQASASIGIGSCPAIAVSSNNFGVTNDLTLVVSGVDNQGNVIPANTYSIPANTSKQSQQNALAKIFGTDIDSLKVTVQYPVTEDANGVLTPGAVDTDDAGILVLSYAGGNASLYVSASVTDALIPINNTTGALSATNATVYTAEGVGFDLANAKYLVESIHAGTGYNLTTTSDNKTRGNSVEVTNLGGSLLSLTVNQDGGAYESYKMAIVSGLNSPLTVLGSTEDDTKSDVIVAKLLRGTTEVTAIGGNFYDTASTVMGGAVTGGNPRFLKLVAGTKSLAGGEDGVPTDSEDFTPLIGDPVAKEGVHALDDELLNLSVAVVPGIHDQEVQNELITLAETTTNFIACVAPPAEAYNTVQEAIDWSNGLADERSVAINSSYAAIYWPHVKTFIAAAGQDVTMDPAVYGARQIAYTASVSELWFAPAGFVRGRLTKPTEVTVALSKGDRDAMYSGGNVINPIVNFPQQGITIFGQRTAQRAPSALDRINVRLLTIYLKKVLLRSVTNELFEPNDPILWESIKSVTSTLLEDIKLRRGITEYAVICDETTNTPARIERNELWCKVIIKPTKTAEAIVFELNLAAQSATISQ